MSKEPEYAIGKPGEHKNCRIHFWYARWIPPGNQEMITYYCQDHNCIVMEIVKVQWTEESRKVLMNEKNIPI